MSTTPHEPAVAPAPAALGLALLPRLGPRPPLVRVALFLAASAWALLLPASLRPWALLPMSPDHPDGTGTVNLFWLVQRHGLLGATHSRLLAFPFGIDRTVVDGFPLDALTASPLLDLLGWPAGFTVFTWAILWSLGLAAAWWAGRWWQQEASALIAGVAFQCSAYILNELCDGRTSQIFGAIFLPLALAAWSEALARGARRQAALAGLWLGLAMLSYWYYGFFFGLALGVLFALALAEGRRPWREAAVAGAAALAVVALPLLHFLAHAHAMPAIAAGLDESLLVNLEPITVAQHVQDRALKAGDLLKGRYTLRPLVPVLATLGLVGARPRQLLAPAVWCLVGAVFAGGVVLAQVGHLVVPGPMALTLQLPLLERLWWPSRGLVLVAPALALLAGGGVRWLVRALGPLSPWILAGLLVVEAHLLLPHLPITPTLMPRPQALVLARGQGPLLVLPLPGGPLIQLGSTRAEGASSALMDQVFHGRPLVDWKVTPGVAPLHHTAGQLYERSTLLRQLWACETLGELALPDHGAQPEAELDLAAYGVTEVVVDTTGVPEEDADLYLACVEDVLGQPMGEEEGLIIFKLRPLATSDASARGHPPPTP